MVCRVFADVLDTKIVDHKDHIIQALKKLYTISINWTGSLYCGLTINWGYDKSICDISMPAYIQEVLHKFHHPAPSRPQDAPHAWNQPVYISAVQYANQPNDSPLLPSKYINLVQQIIGTLLYYTITVEPTMLVATSDIASQQSKATQTTRDATVWLLNYAASHPNSTIQYSASDMVLHLHSDASYLSEPGACSRVGGNYFLGNQSTDPTKTPLTDSPINSPIHTVPKILHNVMASAAESKIGATLHNGQEAVPIRTTLQELGHP